MVDEREVGLSDGRGFDLEVSVSMDEIVAKRTQGWNAVKHHSDSYIESLEVYRKISDGMIDFGIILMHGAAVAVDGKAYIFLARSGVGKTTHIQNWMKVIPVTVVVNGDKPLIDAHAKLVYGTPWCGKESYNTNMSAEKPQQAGRHSSVHCRNPEAAGTFSSFRKSDLRTVQLFW